MLSNSDFNWDSFESDWYHDHNYRSLREDDEQIMTRIRDYFANSGITHGRGVDVGAGPNLYPTLAMLPFCDTLELREFSQNNVAWLRRNVPDYGPSWDEFWQIYRQSPAYANVEDPRQRLARAAVVRRSSVFNLPRTAWDIGAMFFVACSFSYDMDEFYRALDCFVGALRAGAPFAVAFMENSKGYAVDGRFYPAVAINVDIVNAALAPLAYDVSIDRITTINPLRDGYGNAMIVAVGRANG